MEKIKKSLGYKALEYIKDNQIVGLGTGSTANYFIKAIAEKKIKVKVVSSSFDSYKLAKELNLNIVDSNKISHIDVYVDGADQIDDHKNMIKGRGAAFLKEKILAFNSKKVIIIADYSKKVKKLGNIKLPIELLPFSENFIINQLKKMNLSGQIRTLGSKPIFTDSNNYIFDIELSSFIENPKELDLKLKNIPGIFESGLFINFQMEVLIGYEDKIELF